MLERDYLLASNRVRISTALHLMREVTLSCDKSNYMGMTQEDLDTMTRILAEAEAEMFTLILKENEES